MRRILVTGGCGFIGSNFIRHILGRESDLQVTNLDKLTYAGNPENSRDVEGNSRYRFIRGDVADPKAVAQAISGCEALVHFAAESHVDRSILDAEDFLRTNVLGTQVLLEAARRVGIKRFIHISTDEVYGSLEKGAADENGVLHPNSPYSASKAGADHLALAYHVTYGLPVVVIRASNNYGPYQFPEKFLPLMITNAIDEEPLPVYGDGLYVREWLFVEDFCEAIARVLEKGEPGQIYNVGSGDHQVNLEVAKRILKLVGRPESLLRHVTDRLGHDRRYAILSDKVRALGWVPKRRFKEGLEETLRWYQRMEPWWRPLKGKAAAFKKESASRSPL
ncbi:MAG: dTDP-glucose 4,6-dehydratase [Candidatus Omnitrophica bacterium]|nr:dTDP-glucose 4,6-dehydratase [Candidatus Omnitrophota bacterium]